MGNSIFSFWDWEAVSQYVRRSQSSWVILSFLSEAGRLSISILGSQSSFVLKSGGELLKFAVSDYWVSGICVSKWTVWFGLRVRWLK